MKMQKLRISFGCNLFHIKVAKKDKTTGNFFDRLHPALIAKSNIERETVDCKLDKYKLFATKSLILEVH